MLKDSLRRQHAFSSHRRTSSPISPSNHPAAAGDLLLTGNNSNNSNNSNNNNNNNNTGSPTSLAADQHTPLGCHPDRISAQVPLSNGVMAEIVLACSWAEVDMHLDWLLDDAAVDFGNFDHLDHHQHPYRHVPFTKKPKSKSKSSFFNGDLSKQKFGPIAVPFDDLESEDFEHTGPWAQEDPTASNPPTAHANPSKPTQYLLGLDTESDHVRVESKNLSYTLRQVPSTMQIASMSRVLIIPVFHLIHTLKKPISRPFVSFCNHPCIMWTGVGIHSDLSPLDSCLGVSIPSKQLLDISSIVKAWHIPNSLEDLTFLFTDMVGPTTGNTGSPKNFLFGDLQLDTPPMVPSIHIYNKLQANAMQHECPACVALFDSNCIPPFVFVEEALVGIGIGRNYPNLSIGWKSTQLSMSTWDMAPQQWTSSLLIYSGMDALASRAVGFAFLPLFDASNTSACPTPLLMVGYESVQRRLANSLLQSGENPSGTPLEAIRRVLLYVITHRSRSNTLMPTSVAIVQTCIQSWRLLRGVRDRRQVVNLAILHFAKTEVVSLCNQQGDLIPHHLISSWTSLNEQVTYIKHVCVTKELDAIPVPSALLSSVPTNLIAYLSENLPRIPGLCISKEVIVNTISEGYPELALFNPIPAKFVSEAWISMLPAADLNLLLDQIRTAVGLTEKSLPCQFHSGSRNYEHVDAEPLDVSLAGASLSNMTITATSAHEPDHNAQSTAALDNLRETSNSVFMSEEIIVDELSLELPPLDDSQQLGSSTSLAGFELVAKTAPSPDTPVAQVFLPFVAKQPLFDNAVRVPERRRPGKRETTAQNTKFQSKNYEMDKYLHPTYSVGHWYGEFPKANTPEANACKTQAIASLVHELKCKQARPSVVGNADVVVEPVDVLDVVMDTVVDPLDIQVAVQVAMANDGDEGNWWDGHGRGTCALKTPTSSIADEFVSSTVLAVPEEDVAATMFNALDWGIEGSWALFDAADVKPESPGTAVKTAKPPPTPTMDRPPPVATVGPPSRPASKSPIVPRVNPQHEKKDFSSTTPKSVAGLVVTVTDPVVVPKKKAAVVPDFILNNKRNPGSSSSKKSWSSQPKAGSGSAPYRGPKSAPSSSSAQASCHSSSWDKVPTWGMDYVRADSVVATPIIMKNGVSGAKKGAKKTAPVNIWTMRPVNGAQSAARDAAPPRTAWNVPASGSSQLPAGFLSCSKVMRPMNPAFEYSGAW